MKKIIAFLFLFATTVYAAGDGGHGSPKDLFWPVVNFSVLMAFLVFKSKKPLEKMFNDMMEEVEASYIMAETKDKQAQKKLNIYKEKMSNFNGKAAKTFE